MNKTMLADVAAAVGGVLSPSAADVFCEGVTIDSRRVSAGDLFVAVVGERVDGNDYAPSAVRAGAAACMVSRVMEASIPTVLVPDTAVALGALAAYHRSRLRLPVIAVTGSNGKTTTKDMIAAVLEQEWSIVKTAGNQNNEIGLPLTLLRLDSSHRAAVVEMGMRGPGQIAHLAALAAPSIGVVTNVGDTHMELLGSREAIGNAKAELVEALPADGVAVLNWDDPIVRGMGSRSRADVCFYGLSPGAHVRADGAADLGQGGLSFRLRGAWRGRSVDLQACIPVPGMHNVENALAACAVALVTGMGDESIVAGLACFEPTASRLQVVDAPSGITVVDDTYNASPASTRAAVSTLVALAKGRRAVAVLADMLELGTDAAALHRDVGIHAAHEGTTVLVTVGGLGQSIAQGYASVASHGTVEHFEGKGEAIRFLLHALTAGDVVLVKGSRGMKMEEVVAALLAAPEVYGGRQS